MDQQVFRGNLYGPENPSESFAVELHIEFDAIRLKKESGQEYEVLHDSLSLSRGGFDNLSIILKGATRDGKPIYAQIQEESFLTAYLHNGPASKREKTQTLISRGNTTRVWKTLSLTVLILFVVAGILATYLFSKNFAQKIVDFVPVSLEASLGEATARSVTQGKTLITAGPVFNGVNQVFQRVISGIANNPYTFKLYLVDHATVNALAAPGGHIVIFTGLLANTENPEELAGIIAHECAHAIYRHSLVRLAQTAGISIFFGIAFGDMGGLVGTFTEFGKELAILSYSRDDEREADNSAVNILVKAQIDPTKFPNFFKRAEADEGNLDKVFAIASTHPSNQERQQRLNELFKQLKQHEFTALPIDWQALQKELSPIAIMGRAAK